jgi:hypothetical protein
MTYLTSPRNISNNTIFRKNKGKKNISNLSKEHGRKDDRKERLHSFNSVCE